MEGRWGTLYRGGTCVHNVNNTYSTDRSVEVKQERDELEAEDVRCGGFQRVARVDNQRHGGNAVVIEERVIGGNDRAVARAIRGKRQRLQRMSRVREAENIRIRVADDSAAP